MAVLNLKRFMERIISGTSHKDEQRDNSNTLRMNSTTIVVIETHWNKVQWHSLGSSTINRTRLQSYYDTLSLSK